jgi:hypothetical protein
LHGDSRQDDSHTVPSAAPLDQTWFTDFINDECLLDQDGQGCQTASESVSLEISSADDAGMRNFMETIQNTSQTFGFIQDHFAFNDSANFNIECDQTAFSANPDVNFLDEAQSYTRIVPPGWNFTGASSPSSFDYNFSAESSASSESRSSNHSGQESQVKHKCRISACESFKCPQCSKRFETDLGLRYVLC